MSGRATSIATQTVSGGGGSGGQRAVRTSEERTLQRETAGQPSRGVPDIVHDVLRSPGYSLDSTPRALMESRFGYDFSAVRIHSDAKAAASARAVNACAYTVGPKIVFGQGQYQPVTQAGHWLLAHELAHVIQQRHCRPQLAASSLRLGEETDHFEREADAQADGVIARLPLAGSMTTVSSPTVQRVSFFEKFRRFIGFEGTFGDPELRAYLRFIDTNNRIEDSFDSDNKARAVVRRWREGAAGYSLSPQRKILLIREMISGFTGDADEAAILDLLAGSPDSELTTILTRVTPAELRGEIHHEERQQLERILAGWQARTGAPGTRDIFAGTRAVSPAEHAAVEATLTPGATVVAAPAPVGAPAPAPVVVPPPAMTGAGVGGAFEVAMLAALRPYVATRGASFRAQRAAGPPGFPIARAHSIGLAAQQQAEAYFAPYTRGASRAPADVYHPGAYSLASTIGDQSAVPISDNGVVVGGVQRPGRIGWTGYWMKQDFTGGAAVLSTFHVIPTRSPDDVEFNRVRNRFATDPANRTDIDDTIHGWPAEATGGVNIQPYASAGTLAAERRTRWDMFTTLLHEFMHVLEHPNYRRTRTLIGGSAAEILKEGMPDVMRRDLWDGPGALHSRVATPGLAPVRRQVEGGDYPYDASVVQYHPDYPMITPARAIVHGGANGPGVGMANAKAAFFLGHTELLGLGAGTATQGGASLVGTADYSATERADAEMVVVRAGDTYASIRARTNAPAAGILDTANNPVVAGAALAPGTRLRVPGIRYVRSLREDTIADIARQNGVPVAALIRANTLAPGTPNSFRFAAGARVLIPIH
jgi:LysM repeat protein